MTAPVCVSVVSAGSCPLNWVGNPAIMGGEGDKREAVRSGKAGSTSVLDDDLLLNVSYG